MTPNPASSIITSMLFFAFAEVSLRGYAPSSVGARPSHESRQLTNGTTGLVAICDKPEATRWL